MDGRPGIETHVLWDTTDEERERPHFWRFWRVLPPRGRIAILFGSWYTWPIVNRTFEKITAREFEADLRQIVDFERMLSLEGVPVIKFWLHLSKKAERKRVRQLRRDPLQRWRLSEDAERFFRRYDDFRRVSERALSITDSSIAPWHIVESSDDRYRNLTVATTVLQRLEDAVKAPARTAPARKSPLPVPRAANVIRSLNLSRRLDEAAYETRLALLQADLPRLARQLRPERRSLTLVFEGPDAAGKGGAIRRVTASLNPQLSRVISVAAPTDEEAAHPYLWRFWRHLPRQGRVTIYDRSWYGRVLVERIEGFAAAEEWRRAYGEINDFERQLAESGIIVLKFWLAISAEEQLRRFTDRQETPYKQYKITEEDWRNREKWDAYEAAACEMIERTSTPHAPWVLVEANDKHWARIKVMKTVVKRLEKELG